MITANPIKHKRGDVREDGMVFWKSNRWLTPEKFEQYRKAHLDGVKRHYSRNIEAKKNYLKKWYTENKELHKSLGYKWANENTKKRKEIIKRHYAKNKESIKVKQKLWAEKNKEKVLLSRVRRESRRRARINKTGPITKDQNKIINCFYEQAKRLEHRLGIKFHVDHIIPIAKGGMHIHTNLQVLPASINIKKKDKEIFVWSKLQTI
jgi:5-methylcytosine-specific restriction endonuclease McrA